MMKLAVSLAILSSVAVSSAQQATTATTEIVKSYLDIQAHLAADRFDTLKVPARALVKEATALGKPGEPLAKAAAAIESASDIKAAREAFGPLSDAVIERVQAEGGGDAAGDLRLAYCPMVKRSWLQREAQIRNPYYGAQMSGCGEFKPLKK